MENYRNKLKKKIILSIALWVVTIGIFIAVDLFAKNGSDYTSSLNIGFISGLTAVMFFNILKIRKALKYEKILKQMYVQENDERNLYVMMTASKMALTAAIIISAMAGVIASYFNKTVSITLYTVTTAIAIIYLCTTAYANKKI